jgi:hypothetical protein
MYIYIYIYIYIYVCSSVALPGPVGGWGCYKLVSELSEVYECGVVVRVS